ncbi:MAG: hypothetical protein M1838_003284 [Thelocarpon superellum]|nr:MAG: hypothetical protein M1838_003284 [Thelocarpon superellum]
MDQQLAEVEADVARFQQKRKRYNVMERAHFRAYTDNLVLDLAAKLASLMSSKERMNHGDILWVKNGTCKHSTARLMRFAATLTDKDLEKHNIPHKYLKCLKELKMHRVTQAEGSRGSEAALAALLLTPPYVNSECFELWAPLLPFVYGYAVHELAARFWNPPFCS